MSEWLTTGQMIDRLKVGEIAECNNEMFEVYWETDTQRNTEVLKFKTKVEDEVNEYIQIEDRNHKWRILPNYVTFEEAMKALKNGKTVNCYPKWRKGELSFEITANDARYKALRFLDIRDEGLMTVALESKWTIES